MKNKRPCAYNPCLCLTLSLPQTTCLTFKCSCLIHLNIKRVNSLSAVLVPLLYLHNTGWAVSSCPEALEEWWSSNHVEGCAPSRSRHFSSGEHKPVRATTNSDTHSWCKTQMHVDCWGAFLGHADCLSLFLSMLESVRLCAAVKWSSMRGQIKAHP